MRPETREASHRPGMTKPLRDLTQKNAMWVWGDAQEMHLMR